MAERIYVPSFLVTDVDEPVRNVMDTGGVPGPEMRLLIQHVPGMNGVWDFRAVEVDLRFNRFGLRPMVRLWVKRTAPLA
jgi:hypothetical protein